MQKFSSEIYEIVEPNIADYKLGFDIEYSAHTTNLSWYFWLHFDRTKSKNIKKCPIILRILCSNEFIYITHFRYESIINFGDFTSFEEFFF